MAFWLGILVAGLFVWLAVKTGFYEMWAMLFNILFSVYLAIFLGPAIVDMFPAAGGSAFSNALAMACTGVGAFLILHCISYTFITGQFTVSFPRILDSLGAALLGFLAGFLVWSFASLLICTSPMSQNAFLKGMVFESRQTHISYVCWWCNLVNKAVASSDNKITCEEAVRKLMESAEKERAEKTSEPNEPFDSVGGDAEDI